VSSVEYVGPFEHHDVVVDGWAVPYLTATPLDAGRVCLHLDRRYACELALADAERVVPFIGECIAVALGYTGTPEGRSPPRRRTEFVRVRAVDS
jgi:hypothetical protein